MEPIDFVYWLNGYVEMGGDTPTEEQWVIIKDHLLLTTNKVTNKLIKKESSFQLPAFTIPKAPGLIGGEIIC